MKLYARVVAIHPLDQNYGGGWPYRGHIYNDQGLIISTDAVGMTEEKCRENIAFWAKRIRDQDFLNYNSIFEV